MTFLEIRQRIAEQLGLDSTDATADANATVANKLKEWVNARYRAIAGKRSWNWLIDDAEIATVADITTGTVEATNASTTITFSSGPTPSVAGWFIQFSDSDDWYEISAHTATQTGATLATEYQGTTSSTLTYTLRKVYYSLPSNIAKILDVKQTRDDIALRYMPPRRLDQLVAERTRTGEPEFYSIVGKDSSGNYKVEFYPSPSSAMIITFRFYQVVTELSADGDIPIIPTQFHDILVWDVLATYGYMFNNDTRKSDAKVIRDELLEDMTRNNVATENIAVKQPFDVYPTDGDMRLRRLDLPIE